MPLILIGVFILVVGLIAVPLITLLFTNPVAFGIGLIVIGVLWIVFSKLFYGLIFAFVKTNETWNEVILPKLETKRWWQAFIKISNKTNGDMFARLFVYGFLFLILIYAIYLEYNPLV